MLKFNNPVMYSDPSGLAPKKEKRDMKLLEAPENHYETNEAYFAMLNSVFTEQMVESRRRQDLLESEYYTNWEEFNRWQAVTENKLRKGISGEKVDMSVIKIKNEETKAEKEKVNKEKGVLEEGLPGGIPYSNEYLDWERSRKTYTLPEINVYGNKEEIDDFSNFPQNLGIVATMTFDWFIGSNPLELSTHENNTVANAMRNAWKVEEARDFFYNKYKGSTDLTNASVTKYGADFGLEGLFRAGVDPVEQFIGSYDINIFSNGQILTYKLTNTTSFKSLFYGVGPDWRGGMMGNWTQTYIFTEPINFNRLRR